MADVDIRKRADEFERQATGGQHSLVREMGGFLMHNKKWWMTPIIIVLLLLGAILAFGGTAAAPFIYTLF